jgi:hypothetical protein
MARIVGVHGIGQQFKGEETLQQEWLPALRDGLHRANATLPDDNDLRCAFYGKLFRLPGTMAVSDPPYDAADVEAGLEQDLLRAWWAATAVTEPGVPGPDTPTMGRMPNWVHRGLNALSTSRFWSDVSDRAMISNIKQVRDYLEKPGIRQAVQAQVAASIGNDTLVMIGHSLGSVVAYEALCANPHWPVRMLLTLGSPLGIPNLIFDRLKPKPADNRGIWPGSVTRWVNIADKGDVVALVKDLGPLFGPKVECNLVHNGSAAHDIRPYLTAEETGRAIATSLANSI